ncbi:tetratricopeptide repeat protein [Nitrospina watsonii]|uniref:Tetratricopeptide repeat protein n=1 Tax=Nitrospina watsonii TaxID=1323948 RepID=A0ABM9HFX6_9BACT|nr:tetratricopeptide repeat protein [Nitrospina watsonii]CAI2719241.1 protein of unknown function [Nitrospina watsonii]
MSLIADSLKKAQKDRDRDKEQIERNVLRFSNLPGLVDILKKVSVVLGWVLILIGGWFTIFVPSQQYQARTKPLILAAAPRPDIAQTGTSPQTGVPEENPSQKKKDTPPPEKGPVEGTGLLAVVAAKPEPPVAVLPETGKKSQAPLLKKKGGAKDNEKEKAAVQSISTTGNQIKTEPKLKSKSKPQPQPLVPGGEKQPAKIPYTPFVKPESSLEQVAALTEGLGADLTDAPQDKMETQNAPEGTQLAQEVPVTSLLNENETVPAMQQNAVPEQKSDQILDLAAEQKSVSGDDSIHVMPNEADMQKWKTGRDSRTMDDKSRYFNIASFHHQNEDYFLALEFYEKAKRLDPGNARIHNNRALIFKKLGRSQEAIRELLQAVRIDPAYVKAYNNLGLMYYLHGDPMSAIRYYEKATEIDSRNVESYNNLAIIYKKQNHYRRAEMLYRKVINLDPKQPEGYYNLALLYEQMNRIPEAIEHYKQFVTRAQSSRPALTMRVRSHIQKLEEKS